MHRARHTAHSSAFRPRLLIALLVAGVGLTFALWLPARNDSASATENRRPAGQSQNDGSSATGNGRPDGRPQNGGASTTGNGRPASRSPGDHRHDRAWHHDRNHDWDHDRDHRRDRRRESPSVAPSASESAAPSGSPTSEAPRATKWAPFTNYVAGQLVIFKGVEYQVQQTHTALPGWEPNVLPTLFKPLD